MKITSTIVLLFLALNISYAQQNKRGVIKTKNGMIIYFNLGHNSYTLDLIGETDFSKFPLVKINDEWFEFIEGPKSDFGNDPKIILNNFMNWEIDHLKDDFKVEIIAKSNFIDHNKMLLNFWQYDPPLEESKEIFTPVKTTYFIDFIHNDLVHRLSYPSISGDELKAKQFLLKLVDGIHFYKSSIDLKKLQGVIMSGKTYYND